MEAYQKSILDICLNLNVEYLKRKYSYKQAMSLGSFSTTVS